MVQVRDARKWVADFDPQDSPRARRSQEAILALLDRAASPFARTNFDPGHITTSAIVFSPDGSHVLLVYHRRLARWLQPGGHVEPTDASMVDAAAREVFEETGVAVRRDLATALVGLDVHAIPGRKGEPAHQHFDLVFGFVASADAVAPPESRKVVWCPIARLDSYDPDEPLRRAVARAVADAEGRSR